MGRLNARLKKLQRILGGESLVIAQKDGSPKRFPQSAGAEAFDNFMARMGAGEDAPPERPLITAAKNSRESKWANSFFAADENITDPIRDLSEGSLEGGSR